VNPPRDFNGYKPVPVGAYDRDSITGRRFAG
jgi:hypothetical protein